MERFYYLPWATVPVLCHQCGENEVDPPIFQVALTASGPVTFHQKEPVPVLFASLADVVQMMKHLLNFMEMLCTTTSIWFGLRKVRISYLIVAGMLIEFVFSCAMCTICNFSLLLVKKKKRPFLYLQLHESHFL